MHSTAVFEETISRCFGNIVRFFAIHRIVNVDSADPQGADVGKINSRFGKITISHSVFINSGAIGPVNKCKGWDGCDKVRVNFSNPNEQCTQTEKGPKNSFHDQGFQRI